MSFLRRHVCVYGAVVGALLWFAFGQAAFAQPAPPSIPPDIMPSWLWAIATWAFGGTSNGLAVFAMLGYMFAKKMQDGFVIKHKIEVALDKRTRDALTGKAEAADDESRG